MYRVVINLPYSPSRRGLILRIALRDGVQQTDTTGEFIEPYLPIGEFSLHPARLRQQFEDMI